jgi:hypothetical protein
VRSFSPHSLFARSHSASSYVSLPARKGVKLTRQEEKEYKDGKAKEASKAKAKK